MTDTASPPGSRRWLMLPVVLLAMFMAGFDIWVVNVAAPSLQRDLHVSDAWAAGCCRPTSSGSAGGRSSW